MTMLQRRLLQGACLFLIAGSAFGGTLQDQDKRITERSEAKKEKPPDNTGKRGDAANSAFGSGTYPSSGGGESFLSSFWGWLVTAPFQYRHDDPSMTRSDDGEWAGGGPRFFPDHELGQATVPYVRFDYNYQWVDGDLPIDVNDLRLELGYKFVAFHTRMTNYKQSDGFTYDLRQYYGVLRYGGSRPDFIPGTFEFGIGLGGVQHAGDVTHDNSVAFTIPLKYHPFEWFGAEFRPAWYRRQEITIGDYDLSASLGRRFVQLRGGYRWVWENGAGMADVLSGPYAGISVSF